MKKVNSPIATKLCANLLNNSEKNPNDISARQNSMIKLCRALFKCGNKVKKRMIKLMHNFLVYSNESLCRKRWCLGLYQVRYIDNGDDSNSKKSQYTTTILWGSLFYPFERWGGGGDVCVSIIRVIVWPQEEKKEIENSLGMLLQGSSTTNIFVDLFMYVSWSDAQWLRPK